MDKLIIKGGSKISGSVNVHGAKNSALTYNSIFSFI